MWPCGHAAHPIPRAPPLFQHTANCVHFPSTQHKTEACRGIRAKQQHVVASPFPCHPPPPSQAGSRGAEEASTSGSSSSSSASSTPSSNRNFRFRLDIDRPLSAVNWDRYELILYQRVQAAEAAKGGAEEGEDADQARVAVGGSCWGGHVWQLGGRGRRGWRGDVAGATRVQGRLQPRCCATALHSGGPRGATPHVCIPSFSTVVGDRPNDAGRRAWCCRHCVGKDQVQSSWAGGPQAGLQAMA